MATPRPDARLADDLPARDPEAWLALVEAGLKGAPFSKLVTKTADGLELQPLYTADDAPAGARLFAPGDLDRPWEVRTIVDAADPAEANRQALQDLQNGAASALLRYAGPDAAGLARRRRPRRRARRRAHRPRPVALDAGFHGPAAADGAERGRRPRPRRAAGAAPRSAVAPTPSGGPGPQPSTAACRRRRADRRPPGRAPPAPPACSSPPAVAVHEAGGTEAQELGFAAAAALDYARAAEAAGWMRGEALAAHSLGLAADGRYFLTSPSCGRCTPSGRGSPPAAGAPLPARIEARWSARMLSAGPVGEHDPPDRRRLRRRDRRSGGDGARSPSPSRSARPPTSRAARPATSSSC